MSINLVNLSRNVFENVCAFLDDGSLLRLREVSKAAKDLVDVTSLNARKTIVERIRISEDTMQFASQPSVLHFYGTILMHLKRRMDYFMWKNCLISVLPPSQMKHINFYDHPNTFIMAATFNMNEMRIFLECTQHLIRGAQFNDLWLYCERTEILEMCSTFFEAKFIPTVSMYQWRSETNYNSSLLELIKKLKPMRLSYQLKLITNETIDFLFKLAEMAKQIEIWFEREGDIANANIAFVIREMMNRKCEYISIYDNNYTESTVVDVEQLVQFFHTLDKKVEFRANIDADPMQVKIGQYDVCIRGNPAGNQSCNILSIIPI